MKYCRNCGTELGDQAIFCHECGASYAPGADSSPPAQSGQPLTLSKEVFYVVIIALVLMGILVAGLAIRGPGGSVAQTQTNYVTNYVTQMQYTTLSAGFTSSTTTTQAYTVTVASFTTLASGPPPSWFSQQYCGYPFNPYVCNEGPPVTVTGFLTGDSSCLDLYVATGVTYVVWNLPNSTKYLNNAVQVYGFVYPSWPQVQPFPPYPFQKTLCVGIPMWSIAPYIQIA